MAEYLLTTPTALTAGSAVPFTETLVKSCNDIKHRAGSGIFKLKACECCTRWRVAFHGNITGSAATVTLGFYLDGELLPESVMSVVPAAVTDVWSVDAVTVIPAYCNCQSLSVKLISGAGVTINTAALVIDKEA